MNVTPAPVPPPPPGTAALRVFYSRWLRVVLVLIAAFNCEDFAAMFPARFGVLPLYAQEVQTNRPGGNDLFQSGEAQEAQPDLRQYPEAPRPSSFGYRYDDEYAIDPAENPPRTPALSPEEEKLRETYRKEQEKLARKQAAKEKRRFNDEFRLGFAMDAHLGLPQFLDIGDLTSAETVPAPYFYYNRILNASPVNRTIPVFNNYYELSMILHFSHFMELMLGLGYQSDSFLSPLATVGDEKQYFQGQIQRQASYAVRYQKDTIFFELGVAFLLPWVLSARTKTLLGLRVMLTAALGIPTSESLELAEPRLPDSITIFNTNPVPSYSTLQKSQLNSQSLTTRLAFSVGGYFEIMGFRFYVGYSLRYFPVLLYPETRYHIVQYYVSGQRLQYSSIGFPQVQLIHSLNISFQYFLNPLEILGKRGVYTKIRKKRRPERAPLLRHRIG